MFKGQKSSIILFLFSTSKSGPHRYMPVIFVVLQHETIARNYQKGIRLAHHNSKRIQVQSSLNLPDLLVRLNADQS